MSEPKSAKILVTVPADLHDRIKDKAESMRRSLSGYVAYVMDRELPPPTSLGAALDKAIAKKVEELQAQVVHESNHELLFFRDKDGVMQPCTVNAEGYPTIREVAVSLVLQEYGVAMSKRVLPWHGAIHLATEAAKSTGWTECHKWYKAQGVEA